MTQIIFFYFFKTSSVLLSMKIWKTSGHTNLYL